MVDVVVNNVMSLSATDMDYSQFLFKDEVSVLKIFDILMPY